MSYLFGNLFFIKATKYHKAITKEDIYGIKKHLKNTTGKINPKKFLVHIHGTSVNLEAAVHKVTYTHGSNGILLIKKHALISLKLDLYSNLSILNTPLNFDLTIYFSFTSILQPNIT